jgi:1,2-phenylacetyl-CoA epoxidase PaaB subunit
MAKFHFYLDQKCTTWYRTAFEVDADSQEEATQKAIEIYSSGELSDEPWEVLDETTEPMQPSENGGQPTEELMFDGVTIKTN